MKNSDFEDSSDMCKLPQVPKSKENKVPSALSRHEKLTDLSDCK
jgi:hypothetical protein